MAVKDKYLFIKKSQIPIAGKGLYTNKSISKGSQITEYKGIVASWDDTDQRNGKNRYLLYIDKKTVINAHSALDTFGRYANDAKGPRKVEGLKNNSEYITHGKRVFITAKRNIEAGEEIFVGYGKDYWDNY